MKIEEFFPAGWSKKKSLVVLFVVLAFLAALILFNTPLLALKGSTLPEHGIEMEEKI